MSGNPSHRWPSLMVGLLLFTVAAMGVTSLAIHPPLALRKARTECQVSGKVTSQCRPVIRGTICFSCVMLPDSPEIESFPDVTVRIEDGSYVIASEDGLVPGRYEVTVRAQVLGAEAGDVASSRGHRIHHPGRDLVLVASDSPTVADFEL